MIYFKRKNYLLIKEIISGLNKWTNNKNNKEELQKTILHLKYIIIIRHKISPLKNISFVVYEKIVFLLTYMNVDFHILYLQTNVIVFRVSKSETDTKEKNVTDFHFKDDEAHRELEHDEFDKNNDKKNKDNPNDENNDVIHNVFQLDSNVIGMIYEKNGNEENVNQEIIVLKNNYHNKKIKDDESITN